MTKWTKKSLVGLAVAGALGITSGAAQATALANSIMDLSNFAFYNHAAGSAVGAELANGTNITVLSFVSTGKAQSTLNGTPLSVSGTGPPIQNFLDIGPQCTSIAASKCTTDARLANNAFTAGIFTHGADPSYSVSSADQLENGAPVDGIPAISGGGSLPNKAHVGAYGVTSVLDGNNGNSLAQNTLTSQFTFIADTGGIVDIDFNANAYLEAFSQAGKFGVGQASYSLSFKLVDNISPGVNITVFAWAPDGAVTAGGAPGGTEILDPFDLNATVTAAGPLGGQSFVGGALGVKNTGEFQAETGVLIAGHTYTLGIDMKTSTLAQAFVPVPEPGVLMLVGAGLLGLWGTRRRSLNS